MVLHRLQAAGLLAEFDGGSLSRLVQTALPGTDPAALLPEEPVGERDVLRVLLTHWGITVGTPTAARDGLLLPWPPHDADRSERVWVVGKEVSFLLVCDTLPELGPPVGTIPWQARTGPR